MHANGHAAVGLLSPCLENLEQRLLLTTIHGGEFFIYQNSHGDAVRIDLEGSPTDAIEVLTNDAQFGLTDLVGLYNGNTFDQQVWPDGSQILKFDAKGKPSWLGYVAPTDTQAAVRGAENEIYAIYVSSAGPDTVLRLSTLSAAQPTGNNWTESRNYYASSSPTIYLGAPDDQGTQPEMPAPAGSGGVLIGALHTPAEKDYLRYVAVGDATDSTFGQPHGVFPGGSIHAGITDPDIAYSAVTKASSGAIFPSFDGAGLGTNAQAIATITSGNGHLTYAVDDSPFGGRIISPTSAGDLGTDVQGLTSDGTTMWAVNNDPRSSILAGQLGNGVASLAADPTGQYFFAIDNATHHLMRRDASGVVTNAALHVNPAFYDPTWTVGDINALDFNPADGQLYGVTTITGTDAPTGPQLVTISANGVVDNVLALRMADLSPAPADIGSIAFDGQGNLWAATSTSLYRVNINTGIITSISDFHRVVGARVTPISGVTGIDFVYSAFGQAGTPYVVTNTALYRVQPATGVCAIVAFTQPATVNLDQMSSLTYDLTRPGSLFTTTQVNGVYQVAEIKLAATLEMVDTTNGRPTIFGPTIGVEPTYALTNISALDYNSGDGRIWAVATVGALDPVDFPSPYAAGARVLVQIDRSTGQATLGAALSGAATDLSSISFDTGGNLYGVNASDLALYAVDSSTGVVVAVGNLPVTGFTGIQFMQLGGNEALYGVTGASVYDIDKTNPSTAILMGQTGQTTMSSLAWDPNQGIYTWSTALVGGQYRLVRISAGSSLIAADDNGVVSEHGLLADSQDSSIGYTDIRGMDFDSNGRLWAIASMLVLDPIHNPTTATGPYLVQIDTNNATVTQVFPGVVLAIDEVGSIAFNSNDVLYAVDVTTRDLVTISTGDGTVRFVSTLSVPNVTGIDFIGNTLYAVDNTVTGGSSTGSRLYTVNLTTGLCTPVESIGVDSMSGLSNIPGDTRYLYGSAKFGSYYQLIRIDTAPTGRRDIGDIIVAGVVAGTVEMGRGSVGMFDMGYIWGKVDVSDNIDSLIIREGGGGVSVTTGTGPTAVTTVNPPINGNIIYAGNSIRQVDALGGTLYASIEVGNAASTNPNIPEPPNVLQEIESEGNVVGTNNDTQALADFLSHPSGTFYVYGSISNGQFFPGSIVDGTDYYALPLMAGQTVMIDGGVNPYVATGTVSSGHDTNLNNLAPFMNYVGVDGLLHAVNTKVGLYDSAGRMLDSLGYQTIEDRGLPKSGMTQKPILFTAREAGIYYLKVTTPPLSANEYTLKIVGGTAAELGAVHIQGTYDGSLNYQYMSAASLIRTDNGGTIGAISAVGPMIDTDTFSTGSIIAYSADTVTFTGNGGRVGTIHADNNIGLIAIANDVGLYPALPLIISVGGGTSTTRDSYIQNIYCGGTLSATITAAGNIGVIEVVGDMLSDVWVNSDAQGAVGHVDLIDVGGNWGSNDPLRGFIPHLKHGVGGDFGYVHVGGSIFGAVGSWIIQISPTTYTDGRTVVLNDDGGGKLTVDPQPIPVLDANGFPVLNPDGTPQTTPVTVSFTYIGVDDDAFPGTGVGGVIANLAINGTATLSAVGIVQLTELDMSGLAPNSSLTLSGSGRVDVYHATIPNGLVTFDNKTPGAIVSADFGDITTIRTAGNIGAASGHTGAWIFGFDPAPTATVTSQPQYGYFHGRINGLNISGNLGTLNVAGSLGDLRVQGTIGNVVVNSDGITPAGGWDGVEGIVWSGARLTSINVGDGLADDGGANVAQAGIFSTRSIGKVLVDGARYVQDGRVYHELNGAIMAGSDDVITVTDPLGNPVSTPVDGIGQIIGTHGAQITAMVFVGELDAFDSTKTQLFTGTGQIGLIDFSGAGSKIHDMSIEGTHIGTVKTSADSDGIDYVQFTALRPANNDYTIDQILAGGPGLSNSTVSSNGGNVGVIKGVGSVADLYSNVFVGTDGFTSFAGRYFYSNEIHSPGKIGSITTTADMFDCTTVLVGSIGKISVGGDFSRNRLTVASSIDAITVGGEFDQSDLILQGPSTADLKSLVVGGDITGWIGSGSHIGSIISQGGRISAAIVTFEGGLNPSVDLIQAANGLTSEISIAGDLKKLVAGNYLGSNPATNAGLTQRMNILGNLGTVRVSGAGDLFASLNVGGDLGTLDIDGTLYGIVSVNGNMGKLMVDGGLGGQLDTNGDGVLEPRGRLSVMGTIGSMAFPSNRDIFADLSVGGSITGITLKGGSIRGAIESRYGSIGTINLTNGSVMGDITARSIGKVSVTGGNINGDITTHAGSIKSLILTNGTLNGNVTVQDGTIDVLTLSGANATAGEQITASGGLGKVTVTRGNMAADLTTQRDIKSLTVTNGTLTGKVWAQTGIGPIKVTGQIQNATIRTGGKITSLNAAGLSNATISSARDIGAVTVAGTVDNSNILAGLDIGPDGLIGTADDVLHSGNIASMTIGTLKDSILAAGVGPGADHNYKGYADNVDAAGVSRIVKLAVKNGFGGTNGVLADSSVDPKFRSMAAGVPGLTIDEGIPASAIATPYGPDVFGSLAGIPIASINGLNLSLTNGLARYDGAGNLYFEQTSSKSVLTISSAGSAVTLNIVGADDACLGSLVIGAGVTVNTMNVDGTIGTLSVPAIANGAAWALPGGVQKTATLGEVGNLNLTAGPIGTMNLAGSFQAGHITADAVGTFKVAGTLAGGLKVDSATQVNVGGNMWGTIQSTGTVGTLAVGGTLGGQVDVYGGDLLTVRVGNGMSGAINVGQQYQTDSGGNSVLSGGGYIKTVLIGGTFGLPGSEASVRTAYSVGTFTVTGNFAGLLSAGGDLKTLSVAGTMSGRAWADGVITTAKMGAMTSGLLAASSDIKTVGIAGTMSFSWIMAGFNPGDAGYDAVSGEQANLQLDAVTNSVNPAWLNADNADHVLTGRITTVTIGGNMDRSTIAAGVGPGVDGWVGTADDNVRGTGYVTKVTVRGDITGSINAEESFGVYAASAMPKVFYRGRQPFLSNGNARVDSMQTLAGSLAVTDVVVSDATITVYLSHAADVSTLPSLVNLIASTDSNFATTGDNQDISSSVTVSYDASQNAIVLTLNNAVDWTALGAGNYFRLTLPDTIQDIRGNKLDGEFINLFPSGDGNAGGNFVYNGLFADSPDAFVNALATAPLILPLNGSMVLGNAFNSADDVDIFHFTASAYQFFSVQYTGGLLGNMGVFHLDDQGTADVTDDTYELVARHDAMEVSTDNLFEAFELPAAGDYFVAVTPASFDSYYSPTYQLSMSLASNDVNLVHAIGGALPADKQIAYVSNTVGQHHNLLGANSPKQLVYLNFSGGTTTAWDVNIPVGALNLSQVDPTVTGMESRLINGGSGVTGIVDNMVSIYRTTAPSDPDGQLTVNRIDISKPADWATYQAATKGLWFTTVDPATVRGLNPNVDFTTIFVGGANTVPFGGDGGLLGMGSGVDLANMNKGGNAVVFAQDFSGYTPFIVATTQTEKLNAYSKAFANTAAHELGHLLGLNHQPTESSTQLYSFDDPDNNSATPNDSNTGDALMGYPTMTVDATSLEQLGTASITANEFPVGDIDTQDLMLKWLS